MSIEPTKQQIGGTHYVNMGMQPIHFAMVNGWDAGAFSILKYLSRHRSKNGLEDLKKARHFVDLRQAEHSNALTPRAANTITIGRYIRENELDGFDATALVYLDDWVHSRSHIIRRQLIETIELLIGAYEPTPLP